MFACVASRWGSGGEENVGRFSGLCGQVCSECVRMHSGSLPALLLFSVEKVAKQHVLKCFLFIGSSEKVMSVTVPELDIMSSSCL